METTTLPAVGDWVRALYIPLVTDIDGTSNGHDYRQKVKVTKVERYSCRSKDDIVNRERVVLYGLFERPYGDTSEYYFSDWEPVGEPATDTGPADGPLHVALAEIADLNDRLAKVQEKLTQTISFLGELNGNLNQAADDQSMCDVYENFIEEQNSLLLLRFPLVPFSFEGREVEKEFYVTRTRTITERVCVTVNAPFGTEQWRLTQMAEEQSHDEYDWDVIDEDIDDLDVEEA
jgi:hypothetical protein